MFVCVYNVCMYMCKCVSVCICVILRHRKWAVNSSFGRNEVCVYVCACMCQCVCAYVSICVYTRETRRPLGVGAVKGVCMYVCMYVCIYMCTIEIRKPLGVGAVNSSIGRPGSATPSRIGSGERE